MAAAEGRMRFKVYLDEGQRVADIFVSPSTQCRDIVHRLQRQIQATDCFLLEVWQGCERLVPDNESILSTLLEWGSDLEGVKFYLRHREEPPSFTQVVSNGPLTISKKINGFKEEPSLSRDVLLGGGRISVDDLKEFAARQQQEIAAKERELKAKQIQFMEMKRKSQNRAQNPYVKQLSAKADEQGERLAALRLVQDQVDSHKLSNSALAEELDSVRSMFMEKETELAIAVAKVESLTQQLDKQRQGWSQSSPSREKTHQQLELERLRKELMTRNELNHQQSVQIQSQKQLLAEKHKELFDLDSQIDQYTDELRHERSRNNHINGENGSSSPSPTGEQDFVEMDYSNLGNFAKRTNKPSGADSKNGSAPITSGSFRARSRNSSKLETLLEVEEEVSDGHASNKSSMEDLTQGPGPPRLSRVTALMSRFKTECDEDREKHRSAHDELSQGKKTFMDDIVLSKKFSNSILNSSQRVEPEGVETPDSPTQEIFVDENREESFSYRQNVFLGNSYFETKPSDKRSETKRGRNLPSQEGSFEVPYSVETKHILPESDVKTEAPCWDSGRSTPSDEGDASGFSSPSSLSSYSSVSSNSTSHKAAVFAVTGMVTKTDKSHGLATDSPQYETTDGRVSLERDFLGFHKVQNSEALKVEVEEPSRDVLNTKSVRDAKGDILNARRLKSEGFPTRNENVGSVARQTVLDFSRAGNKFKQVAVTDKLSGTSRSNVAKEAPSLTKATTAQSSVKTAKVQLSRLQYPTVLRQQHAMNINELQTHLKGQAADQSSKMTKPSKEIRKTEYLSDDRRETRLNINATRSPQNSVGTNRKEEDVTVVDTKRKVTFSFEDNVHKAELHASSLKLPQNSVSTNSVVQKGEEVAFSSSSGSSNDVTPLGKPKRKVEFSLKDNVHKTELNASSLRSPQSSVRTNSRIHEGEEVTFSPSSGSSIGVTPLEKTKTKRKVEFSLKDNVHEAELNASPLRSPQNYVRTNSLNREGEELTFSPNSGSSNTTTPLGESKRKVEFSAKDDREKTKVNTSSSTLPQNSISMDNFIPKVEEATSSPSFTQLNKNEKLETLKNVTDETANAKKLPGEESPVRPTHFAPLTFKPISYRAKKLADEQRDDCTSANRSQLAPLISNSISIRGQSSLTKITVTPSATFFSSGSTDRPEKRSPVPTSKRTRFMNRGTGPNYPEVKDSLASSESGEENFENDNDQNHGESVDKESLDNEATSQNDSMQNNKGLISEETNLNQQKGQRTMNLARTRETPRADAKQVVSSFNIQLSSQGHKPVQKKDEMSLAKENNESDFLAGKTSGLLTAASKIVDGKELNSDSKRLSSESGRVSSESTRPSSGSGRLSSESNRLNTESARPSSGSGRRNSESDRLNTESGQLNSESGSSENGGLNSKSLQKFSTSKGHAFRTVNNENIVGDNFLKGHRKQAGLLTKNVSTTSLIKLTLPKQDSTLLKDNAEKKQFVVRESSPSMNTQKLKVSAKGESLQSELYSTTATLNDNTDHIGPVKSMQDLATDERKVLPASEEKGGLKSLFLLGLKNNRIKTLEGMPAGSESRRNEETEEVKTSEDLPVKAGDDDKANAVIVNGTGLVCQTNDSVSDELSCAKKDSTLTAGLVGQSHKPISDQLLDNSSVSTMQQGPISSTEVFSNEITSLRGFGEETQAPAQKADRTKKARHVSLDPHAVLLDAAVEGELDLVKHIVSEVDDPSKPNSDGITALHNAVCASHDEVVEFLVQYGCNINSQDSHGWTPLHCAAANNAADMTRFLIEHGACILAVTSLEKKTPVQCCERGLPGYFSCMRYLNDVEQNFGIENEGRVYALYSYSATEQDELSFECGEELVVLQRGDATEKEWWWAENKNGETGYIPRNLLGSHARNSTEV